MKKHIVQIVGPTGAGKSRLAVFLSCRFGGEVISADAFQVYRGFDIGTAKTREEERKGIPHHMIDVIDDCSQFNAWHFLHGSYQAAEEIISRKRLPIVCGGTALYLRVQIKGIFPEKKDSGETRRELKKQAEELGIDALWNELAAADPAYAEKIGRHDRIRIIRGLEILRLSGDCPSDMFLHSETPFRAYRFIRIGLDQKREELYHQINQRVDRMMEDGLVDEVRRLRQMHPPSCPPFRGVGYKEILLHLDGRMNLDQAVDLIKQNSRRFAKRQMTWFRHEKDITWFHPRETERICTFLQEELWKKP